MKQIIAITAKATLFGSIFAASAFGLTVLSFWIWANLPIEPCGMSCISEGLVATFALIGIDLLLALILTLKLVPRIEKRILRK